MNSLNDDIAFVAPPANLVLRANFNLPAAQNNHIEGFFPPFETLRNEGVANDKLEIIRSKTLLLPRRVCYLPGEATEAEIDLGILNQALIDVMKTCFMIHLIVVHLSNNLYLVFLRQQAKNIKKYVFTSTIDSNLL